MTKNNEVQPAGGAEASEPNTAQSTGGISLPQLLTITRVVYDPNAGWLLVTIDLIEAITAIFAPAKLHINQISERLIQLSMD